MFENLSERIEGAFKLLKGQGKISEINVAETLKEIRRALVEADVNYKIAKEFTDTVKEKAFGANVINSISPGQLLIKIVNDELITLMGSEKSEINTSGQPAIILMAGLQGSGKTTFTAKLANLLKSKGKKVMMVAADVYRPAAIDQLHVLGTQIGVHVFSNKEDKSPVSIAKNALHFAKTNGYSIVLIDTAGRLAVDEQMMNEIAEVKAAVNPGEILFVVDSMTGQDAVNTAKAFNDRLNFDGVVLTKLDGDTRGGAALSIRTVVNKPIKFVGLGEKMDALDYFYPDRMAQRILGMGDIVSFVEKAQAAVDDKEAERLQKKLRKAEFDFEDFLSQINQIKRMGNIKDLIGMIPGMNKAVKGMDFDDASFKYIEAIIQSMKPVERKNPSILDQKSKQRIADGSGTDLKQVNQLVTQLYEMRKMMKMMNKFQGGKKMPKMPMGKR
ncbi:MAG: signal recognition particle protein [Bacteroidota bacterium]|nr:signal recognition particle protein [Bacteroidota bacterium]